MRVVPLVTTHGAGEHDGHFKQTEQHGGIGNERPIRMGHSVKARRGPAGPFDPWHQTYAATTYIRIDSWDSLRSEKGHHVVCDMSKK